MTTHEEILATLNSPTEFFEWLRDKEFPSWTACNCPIAQFVIEKTSHHIFVSGEGYAELLAYDGTFPLPDWANKLVAWVDLLRDNLYKDHGPLYPIRPCDYLSKFQGNLGLARFPNA